MTSSSPSSPPPAPVPDSASPDAPNALDPSNRSPSKAGDLQGFEDRLDVLDPSDAPAPWWGNLGVPAAQGSAPLTAVFEGLDLWIHHSKAGSGSAAGSSEWRFVWRKRDEARDAARSVPALQPPRPCEVTEIPEAIDQLRAAGVGAAGLALFARLADRAVVARPRNPIVLLPGAQQQTYLSTPVWVCVGEGSGPPFLELPARQLSDTWFGASTRSGELAYALRTSLRTRLERVGRRSDRAITPVLLRNLGSEPLRIDRFSLPTPSLTLYRDAVGHLWTQRVKVTRAASGESAEVDLERRPPVEAEGAEELSGPRITENRNMLVRAVSSLFG